MKMNHFSLCDVPDDEDCVMVPDDEDTETAESSGTTTRVGLVSHCNAACVFLF